MMNKDEIKDIVLHSIKQINEDIGNEMKIQITSNPSIFGGDSKLDSLNLVNLIVQIEEVLDEEHDISIVLANEKAMSQRNSPFKDLDSLTNYIFDEISNG